MKKVRKRNKENKAVDSHEPVRAKHLQVTLDQVDGNVDKMIRKFMKKVRTDGILFEVTKRSTYEKPSVKRRNKSAKARKQQQIQNQQK